jgi:hypothetical protein
MVNRRFLLSDLMALIVAIAAGAAWIRSRHDTLHFALLFNYLWLFVNNVFGLCCRFASTLSVAVFVLSLRKPRPKRRLLARRPGYVACLLSSMLSLVSLTIYIKDCLIV